ncbi:MAG: hypothetical protein AAF720_15570 [Pseudomonadota bacterium]
MTVTSAQIDAAIEELNRVGINPYEVYDGAAPIVGTYAGFEVGPSAGTVGGGLNVVKYFGFDRTTGKWFEATYLGGTAGLGFSPGVGPISGSVEGGTFAYTGSIEQFEGLSMSFETSSPVQAGLGVSLFTGGENWGVIAYGGLETAVEVEAGAGWTWVNQSENRAVLEQAFDGIHHVQVIPTADGYDVIQWGAVTPTGQANINWPIRTWHYEVENVNGVDVIVQAGVTVHENPMINQCFEKGVSVSLWPLDNDIQQDAEGIYNQDEVSSKIWTKPIELVQEGETVVSFDKNGNLVPGKVARTFEKDTKIILDFYGTRVTPGHVYFRPDSKTSHKYETLIDILRDDGVVQLQDGTQIRAATNAPVGSARDGFVQAVTGTRKPDGSVEIKERGRVRLGTRFLAKDGESHKSWTVADLIEAGGGVIGDDEMIHVGDDDPVPFYWEFGDTLPAPEDFVLACSGTTLEDIYKASEWESRGPRLPAPMVLDGGPVQPAKGATLSAMPRNEPLDVAHTPSKDR